MSYTGYREVCVRVDLSGSPDLAKGSRTIRPRSAEITYSRFPDERAWRMADVTVQGDRVREDGTGADPAFVYYYFADHKYPVWLDKIVRSNVPDSLHGSDDLDEAKAMVEELVARFLHSIGTEWRTP